MTYMSVVAFAHYGTSKEIRNVNTQCLSITIKSDYGINIFLKSMRIENFSYLVIIQ